MHLFSTPTHSCQSLIPADVTVVARRAPIPLFGAGLVEAIPDDTILALDDAMDRNRDGISGRAAIVEDVATGQPHVGRFGWKAQHATLLAFSGDAYRNEMGITQRSVPDGLCVRSVRRPDETLRSHARSRRQARSRDRPARHRQFRIVHAPARPGRTRRVNRPQSRRRAHLRRHRLRLLPRAIADDRSVCRSVCSTGSAVPLFSDLLLHDVGTGDGIKQAAAAPEEIRTPALWGLRLRRPLLHDGSAATPADAIVRHRNEAELARQGFERLSAQDRSLLLNFLNGL